MENNIKRWLRKILTIEVMNYTLFNAKLTFYQYFYKIQTIVKYISSSIFNTIL